MKLTLKNTQQETQYIHYRIALSVVIAALLILTLIARVVYLQVIKHKHFTTRSQDNRVKVLPLAPTRGLIFTRDGVLVADNQPTFNLELLPEKIEHLDTVLVKLSALLDISEKNIAHFKALQNKKRRFDSIPLKFNLSDAEVARFAVERHDFPGVRIIARLERRYPDKDAFVHVLGYVGRIDEDDLKTIDASAYLGTSYIGKLGVEYTYETALYGKVGYQQVEVDAQGRILRVLKKTPPEPGHNIHLTIDHSLQSAAVKLMNGKRGAIVALDPTNGDVLAFVGAPAYDPNPFVNGIDKKSYDALLDAADKPLINRPLNGKYPPGSTIKPFIAIAALHHEIRSPEHTTWCRGWYSLPGSRHRYRDWKKQGHGEVDLHNAIAQSCDVYFYTLAHDLGIGALGTTLGDFGYGSKTGIDLNGESDALVPSGAWKRHTLQEPWYAGETVITGIGQGYLLVTPLQLATATAMLANHGQRIQPRLVAAIGNPVTAAPIAPRQILSTYNPAHWDTVIRAMRAVVHGPRGTARASGANTAYTFAGKTGTSQVIGVDQNEEYDPATTPEHLQDHSLFIAFAPVESPTIALAVIVENGGSGSATAAPIARALLDHHLLDASGKLK